MTCQPRTTPASSGWEATAAAATASRSPRVETLQPGKAHERFGLWRHHDPILPTFLENSCEEIGYNPTWLGRMLVTFWDLQEDLDSRGCGKVL